MKTIITILILLSFIGCKNEISPQKTIEPTEKETEQIINETNNNEDAPVFSEESLEELDQEKTKSIKRDRLIAAIDDKIQLQKLVISKQFYKEEDFYVLDYKYPYLNESIDSSYAVFNKYITETYLDIEATENEILEDKVIFCDSLGASRCMDKRIIDYKIYTAKNNLMSVLLYKENYYSGMKHSTYMFECLNFELDKYQFIYYNDFFEKGSEKELFTNINRIITNAIHSGELYYDCWELSEGDFKAYKNNFVINDDTIEFYFDDCVICPSYTGTYSVEIPIKEIMHLIKSYNNPPIIG
ncbi:RsiV family protein [Aquimarina sp. MMG016]|uniref:RsiV family protein n=1 Tax=Aquimarina sp. MMG016 TaxID=2822690 RepID=UPI001B3A0EF1|nr:RsiV family protein [Aquimarina sp. MMG016]MBQ4819667.1 DUF3298 domain-containing protein [Aquimarina sp. MMG016]